MARVQSYNRYHLRKILREHDRTAARYKNYVDPTRSHLNYGYGKNKSTADNNYLHILSRCNTIMEGRKMQKQTNVISEWIVTYPARLCTTEKYDSGKVYSKGRQKGQKIIREYHKPIDPVHCKKFFDVAYRFMQERYGKDNVIAGYVHMDETTPQIHVVIVPETISRKSGKRTVSSVSLLRRSELHNFHKDLQKEMINVFGKDASDYILNGRTQGGYTIDELKKRKRDREEIVKRAQEIKKKEAELAEREKALEKREKGYGITHNKTSETDSEFTDWMKANGKSYFTYDENGRMTDFDFDKRNELYNEFLKHKSKAEDKEETVKADSNETAVNTPLPEPKVSAVCAINLNYKQTTDDEDEKEKELTHSRYKQAQSRFSIDYTSRTRQRSL